MIRIDFQIMKKEFERVFLKREFSTIRAKECALLFAEASLDGVYSHGLNRVPPFVNHIDKGWVNIQVISEKVDEMGQLERYDGKKAPGNLNAKYCMNRAIDISQKSGIGIVTIKNTNHWMRGGSYGWQAANEGCIGICRTNTESVMPPWGAKETKIGNNPLVFAVPKKSGNIVLDMAMSQLSYGKLEMTRLKNELLPIDGGFDSEGNLTKVPSVIESTRRILPTGYWKGSGLSILIDLIGALVSGGLSTSRLDELQPDRDISGYGSSQVFVAIDASQISGKDFVENTVYEAIEHLHEAEPAKKGGRVYYPGGRTLATREENLEKGIPVDNIAWQKVLEL